MSYLHVSYTTMHTPYIGKRVNNFTRMPAFRFIQVSLRLPASNLGSKAKEGKDQAVSYG